MCMYLCVRVCVYLTYRGLEDEAGYKIEGGPSASCSRSDMEKGQSAGESSAGVSSSKLWVDWSTSRPSESIREESSWMSFSIGLAVFPAKPSGVSPTLSGIKGHITNSRSACVGGQPKRFLSTAKNPSTAAAPNNGNGKNKREK